MQISGSPQVRSLTSPTQPRLSSSEHTSEPTDQVQLNSSEPTLTRREIPGNFIVSLPSERLQSIMSHPDFEVEQVLGQASGSTYMQIQTSPSRGLGLEEQNLFSQVFPNYEYDGQLYDTPVEEPTFMEASVPSKRPGHLDIINIDPAWEKTKGSPTVLAAVTDTGLDVAHPVLQGTIWNNPGEVANGKDDDGNGYVDDLIGWDFSDNDSNPSDTRSTHHTHVHGIVHAQEGESGATGVAPGSQSMVARVSGGKLGFTSSVLVQSYLYALNQGAKSINTSFNIDGFVNDKAIENTYRTLIDNDVLLFNSAGNSGLKDPRRSKFEDIVLVASTDTAGARVDKRSSFSNYGSAIDIAAPGKDIVSTLPNGRVGTSSGTSMASPVAMGVDLLVQSANPEWNVAQRWAQIAGTADNIDAVNPGEEGQFGGGRVNAGRALTETLAPPTLSIRETKNPLGSTTRLAVRFDKVLDPATSNQPEAWQIRNSQGETVVQGAPKEIRLLTNEIEFNVGQLPPGQYQLVASAEHLKDPFGQPLDGNRDGQGGDDLVRSFEVRQTPK